jgi:exopolysaccharide biosynthesis polyprenyl glycosylphosphotransferase
MTVGRVAGGVPAECPDLAGTRRQTGPRNRRTAGSRTRPGWLIQQGAAGVALPALGDGLALTAAVLLAAAPSLPAFGYSAAAAVTAYAGTLSRPRVCLRVSEELPRLAAAAALPLPLFMFWTTAGEPIAAAGSAQLALVSAALLVVVRGLVYAGLRAARRAGWLAEPTLVIGTGTLGVEVADALSGRPELGLRPVGFLDSLPPRPGSALPLLGEPSELSDVVSQHRIRAVVVCYPAASDADLVTLLRASAPLPARVYVVPRLYELGLAVPPSCRDEVWGVPLVPLRRGPDRYRRLVKRAFDLLLSTAILVVLAPLVGILMAAVRLSCGRPTLFRQARVTGPGRTAAIVKLRTMTGEDSANRWTVLPEDCSRLGRWLRMTHLDELPQLLNVVRGEMSLVGPRPERPYFAAQFAEVIPRYDDRHRTPGGMTGWAQVHGLYGDTSIAERARFDNHYIENWSPWLDVVILARTLAAPVAGSRSRHWNRGGRP